LQTFVKGLESRNIHPAFHRDFINICLFTSYFFCISFTIRWCASKGVVTTELEEMPPPPPTVIERRAQAIHSGHRDKRDRERRTVKTSGSSWGRCFEGAAGSEDFGEEREEGVEEYGNGNDRRND